MVGKVTNWLYLEQLLYGQDWVHLSEISKKVGKNHSVVRQHLNKFEEMGVLVKQKKGRMSMYKINLDYSLIKDVFVIVEKEKILKKDLIIKEVAGEIHKNLSNIVVIFGSAVSNVKKANDIDVLIIGKHDYGFKELEKRINKKIHIVNVSKLTDIDETLKEEIKKKHLIVEGVEEVVKWLI